MSKKRAQYEKGCSQTEESQEADGAVGGTVIEVVQGGPIPGIDHIPSAGPAILVANHRSYFDSVAMSMAIARSGRTVRFLGKKEVFDAPIVGQVAAAMGGIRVDRGTGSDEPLQAAADALAGGEVVAVMPQGTIPRGPAFFDPELKGRWGAARLAAMSDA